MKRQILLSICLMSIPSISSAGGSIGGGGLGKTLPNEEMSTLIMRAMQPDLGLQKLEIPSDDFRRARLRLSASEEVAIELAGESLLVKQKDGGITDVAESRQLLPK